MSRPSLVIKEYMREVLVTFRPDTDVLRAVHLLLEKGVSGAPVIDRLGNIIGFLSEKDVMGIALDAGYYEDSAGTVERLMSKKSRDSGCRRQYSSCRSDIPGFVDENAAGDAQWASRRNAYASRRTPGIRTPEVVRQAPVSA